MMHNQNNNTSFRQKMQALWENKQLPTALLFFVVFLCFEFWIRKLVPYSMIAASGDAADIWGTISTWDSGKVYESYVLYKGVFSVYPYIWLFRLAQATGMGAWIYIEMYHALLFSYIVVYGLPGIIQKLTGCRATNWQRAFLAVVCFFAWRSTYALDQLMVDLPSCGVFILAANTVMRTFPQKNWQRFLHALCIGLLLGAGLCFSGQYAPAVILLFVYAVHRLFCALRLHKKTVLKRAAVILCVFLVLIGFSSVYYTNERFETDIVNVMRANGAPIRTGEYWLQRAMMDLNSLYTIFSQPQMENQRFVAMLEEELGVSDPTVFWEDSLGAGKLWTVGDYLLFMLTHPVDAFTQYFARLFLALSPNNNHQSVVFLWSGYTLLFIALYGVFQRIKRLKDFFNKKLWVTLAFLSTMIAPMVMTLEMRYALSIQGFVFAAAICSNTLKEPLQRSWQTLKNIWAKRSLRNLGEKRFPKGFVLYILFLCVCFGYIAVLYETAYPADILFNWV